jgi:hypothetical protein
MGYNVQPLRSQQEINDFLFCLRRNKNAERDVFLFLIGINSGLRMSAFPNCVTIITRKTAVTIDI